MNKLFLLAMLMVTPYTAFAQEGSINGSVGVSNDYFFRGVSQIPTGGPAWNVMLEGEHSGFFGGAWAGAVDFGDEASYEYDLWAGYELPVTDDLSVNAGIIQYRYDAGDYAMVEELFAGMTYKGHSLTYYNDSDTDNSYLEAALDVSAIVPVFDASIHYGHHDSDNDFWSFMLSKSFNDLDVYMQVMAEEVTDGEVMDSINFGLQYNF